MPLPALADVTLPDTPVFMLVIDTDAYSGNFERELCAYATGLWSWEMHHGEDEARDAAAADPAIVASIAEKGDAQLHDEHNVFVVETLRATPGRWNDGMGGHFDDDLKVEDKPAHPAYESVAVFLSEPLTEGEMAFVRARAARFAATESLMHRPFAIRDIYQVRHEASGETRLD